MDSGHHLCVAIRHQSYRHDVFQKEPGGEEHLGEEASASRTQALIVKFHPDWTCCLTGPEEVRLQALLQNLHRVTQNKDQLQSVTKLCLHFTKCATAKLHLFNE